MRKIALLASILVFVLGIPFAEARVNVSVNIGLPPPLAFEGPPEMVVVPYGSRYVYMVPDYEGVYFYGGFWYRIYDGHWFRARSYDGPWGYIVRSRVPSFIIGIPPDYYINLSPGYHRIPYGELHRNWRSWDRGRYWNKHDWYRNEFREHQRRHPGDRPARFEGHRPAVRDHDRPRPRVERRPETRHDGGPPRGGDIKRGGGPGHGGDVKGGGGGHGKDDKPRGDDRRGGGDRFR